MKRKALRVAPDDGAGEATAQTSFGAAEPSGHLVTRLHYALRRAMDDELRGLDLNAAQYVLLSELASEPALSAADLARRANVRPQAIAPVVAALTERGLIRRSPHPHNRRVVELCLTSEGRAAITHASTRLEAVEARLVDGLAADRRAEFRRLLRVCLSNMNPRWTDEDINVGDTTTQHAIVLRAARMLVRQHGSSNLELHQVAAEAGVPTAWILRHFGSAERLAAALDDGEAEPTDQIGHALLARVLAARTPADLPIPSLASIDDPAQSAHQRDQDLDREIIRPLSARIRADRPALRAELIGALLIGLGILRLRAHTHQLIDYDDEDIIELFDRAFKSLTEP